MPSPCYCMACRYQNDAKVILIASCRRECSTQACSPIVDASICATWLAQRPLLEVYSASLTTSTAAINQQEGTTGIDTGCIHFNYEHLRHHAHRARCGSGKVAPKTCSICFLVPEMQKAAFGFTEPVRILSTLKATTFSLANLFGMVSPKARSAKQRVEIT
ncbi:hypothetical protein BKA70DRAFT_1322201 [Coprinopsis sp. MPI-PUGE-AT-0042]|nr:hypothetical protein BKA70DRAFT_1322201 [Coprinopsis sp. MPI-PUGE-AT-0042]